MTINVETQRLMTNWAMWKYSGGSIGLAMSGAYALEARGRREEVSMPIIDGEALDVDQAIEQLNDPLKLVLAEYWLRTGTIMKKVRSCRCAVATFYRRLDYSHSRIHAHLAALKQRRRAVNAALSPSQIPLRG